MAMLYLDGFDTQFTETLGRRWAISTGTWTVSGAGGRNGGAGLVSSGSSARIWRPLPSARNRLIVGFAFKLDATVTSGQYRRISQFLSDGAPGLQLGVTGTGNLRLSSAASSALDNTGSTVICEAAGTHISADIWYYVEIQVKFSASLAAGDCKLYLFGTEVASSVSLSSGVGFGGWTAADTFEFGVAGSSTANVTYDDLYILDPGSGSVNIAPRGDCRVPAYRPVGAGTSTDFTPHGDPGNHNCVNEVADDEDSTYVSGDTVGNRDNYTIGTDLTSDDVLIHAVQFAVRARKDGAGSRSIVTSMHTGSGDHDSAVSISLTDSYITALDIWETDPDFTVISGGSIEAARLGFKIDS